MNEPIKWPKMSRWTCYMWGTKPQEGNSWGYVYQPIESNTPNWFVRWMMKIFFGCTWVKDAHETMPWNKGKE